MLQTIRRLVNLGSTTTSSTFRSASSLVSRSRRALLFQTSSKRGYSTAIPEPEKTQLDEVERARAILESRKSGTLTTVDLRISRSPTPDVEARGPPLFGSLMPFVLMARKPSVPIIALRKDEQHYSNIQNVAKSSLTVYPLTPPHINPSVLPLPKINLVGELKIMLDADEIAAMVDKYDEVHPGSRRFVSDREVFEFYEFETSDAYYMKSTGDNIQFTGRQFNNAPSDPIARHSRVLMDKINTTYGPELVKLCKEYGDTEVEEVFIFGLDRLGFDMMGRTEEGNWLEFRFPWPSEITTVSEYESLLEQAVKKMRVMGNPSKTNKDK